MEKSLSLGNGHATPDTLIGAQPVRAACREVVRRALIWLDGATELATAAGVADVCVPAFADVAVVHLLDRLVRGDDATVLVPGNRLLVHVKAEGTGTKLRPARVLPDECALREAMESRHLVHRSAQRPSPSGSTALDLDIMLDRGDDFDPSLDLAQAATAFGGEVVAAPLLCGGLPLGVLELRRGPGRPWLSAGEVEAIEQVAAVMALRLENLRLSACRAVTAAALRNLLPVVPAAVTAVDVNYRYRTARRGDGVGGDWLAVIPLPGSRTAFTVGDVMGHGTAAAVVMGMLRSAIQALAPLHLDPSQVLRQLDDLAVQHQADRPHLENWLATCLYAVYDPVTEVCEIAGAGHPPPVLTGADGTSRLLALEPGTPVGVGAGRYRTSRVQVPAGSQLVLYTDGLVEVRGQDIGHGMAALCDRAAAGRYRPLDQFCRHLLDGVEASDHPDDIALLVARFRSVPADRLATWTLADPGLAGHAGWLTDHALRRWGLHRIAPTVVLLVEQLVADVARHGAGPVTLRLVYGAVLQCEIGHTTGHLPSEPDAATGGAAGLRHPLDGSVRRWGAYRTATGRAVWFECPLPAGRLSAEGCNWRCD